MYWLYNILLLIYWATLIPMLIYRLIHEEGFYQRIKQSIGFFAGRTKRKNIEPSCYLGPRRLGR